MPGTSLFEEAVPVLQVHATNLEEDRAQATHAPMDLVTRHLRDSNRFPTDLEATDVDACNELSEEAGGS